MSNCVCSSGLGLPASAVAQHGVEGGDHLAHDGDKDDLGLLAGSGERGPVMGQSPTGYAAFLPDGRVFFMLTGEARKPAKTDRERADLLSTLVAYTGTYRLDGDKWTTSVEVAWNPEWVGTEQVRSFKLEGERLQVLTPWRVMPNWADKGMSRSIVTFERSR